jgi:aromatic amino acid aminotransferase I
MRSVTKAGGLRPAVARCTVSRAFGQQGRMLHSKGHDLSSAEAVPVARHAQYEGPPRPSAIEEIALRRVKAGKLIAGVAAASNSDMFKGDVSYLLEKRICKS